MNKELFRKEIEQINKQLELITRLDAVNDYLQKYNWIFLHPYSQGMDVAILNKHAKEAENPEESILSFFARKFLDLRTTVHFIEGFYKKRPFLKDYTPFIEESVVLCLQKDFTGAINVLLPVIEGTLRKYLIDKRGDHKKKEIDISELLKAIDDLTKDYVELERKYLRNRYSAQGIMDAYFDCNQEKQILKKHRQYFELWMKQLKNYLSNNLYLNTKKSSVTDTFNRHLIFHALQDDIEFSFSNYLRLFNCLNFLSWAIGSVNENCSILSEANEDEVMDKFAEYLKILVVSEALTETKNSIYNRPVESFKKYLSPQYLKIIKKPEYLIKNTFRFTEIFKKNSN